MSKIYKIYTHKKGYFIKNIIITITRGDALLVLSSWCWEAVYSDDNSDSSLLLFAEELLHSDGLFPVVEAKIVHHQKYKINSYLLPLIFKRILVITGSSSPSNFLHLSRLLWQAIHRYALLLQSWGMVVNAITGSLLLSVDFKTESLTEALAP